MYKKNKQSRNSNSNHIRNNRHNNSGNHSKTQNNHKSAGVETPVDLYLLVPKIRNISDSELIRKWNTIFYNDRKTAMKFLMYLRDPRDGLGERKAFRTILHYMGNTQPKLIGELIRTYMPALNSSIIPFIGRWDDLWVLLDTKVANDVYKLITVALTTDIMNMHTGKPISLLAKWLPSINTSSKDTVKLARMICNGIHMKEADYRKTLSLLRKYDNVTERLMSDHQFTIKNMYDAPQKALRKYQKALRKRDFPIDTVLGFNTSFSQYEAILNWVSDLSNAMITEDDITIERCNCGWKEYVDLSHHNSIFPIMDMNPSVPDNINFIIDTCGKFIMNCNNKFINRYMIYGCDKVLDISDAHTIEMMLVKDHELFRKYQNHNPCNIEKSYMGLLEYLVKNKIPPEDVPKYLLVMSDKSIHKMVIENGSKLTNDNMKSMLKRIRKQYKSNGYYAPQLIHWMVKTIQYKVPMIKNEYGITNIIGLDKYVWDMIINEKFDHIQLLNESINNSKYEFIDRLKYFNYK